MKSNIEKPNFSKYVGKKKYLNCLKDGVMHLNST